MEFDPLRITSDILGREQMRFIAVQKLKLKALSKIGRDFERNSIEENNLAYHIRPHTYGVIDRTGKILREIQRANPGNKLVITSDIAFGELAAAHHDTVQGWERFSVKESGGRFLLKRKRDIGNNERASADGLISYMDRVNHESGVEVFGINDRDKANEAILLTIPFFDPELGTVTQPKFGEHQGNIIAQALALADLGASGMEGLPSVRWDTDALFVEDNLDFAEKFRHPGILVTPADQEWYRERIILWNRSQLKFIEGRKVQAALEIDSMDTRAIGPVRGLFTHFDENIEGVEHLIRTRESMSLGQLMDDMRTTLSSHPLY